MSNEGDIHKRQVGIRLPLAVCRCVEKKFGRTEDAGKAAAFIRALETATADVALSSEDYAVVETEVRENQHKRLVKRGRT